MSRDGWVALPRGAMGLSAVCDCGISWSYSLTFFNILPVTMPLAVAFDQVIVIKIGTRKGLVNTCPDITAQLRFIPVSAINSP